MPQLKLLICIKNKYGPEIDPWRTTNFTVARLELKSLIGKCCFLFERYDLNLAAPLTP